MSPTAPKSIIKGAELYRGKAKTVYHCDDPTRLVMHFRNDTSAFDGARIEQLNRKGEVNNRINAFVMEKLAAAGVPTHFDRLLGPEESLVKYLDMLPVECVVRNIAAGSLCKRLGIEEGRELESPLFEFFLKNDELHDPMINDHHIRLFGWGNQQQIDEMQRLAFIVNGVLQPLFAGIGILLVDYKLEFGMFDGDLILGDEFTPDGCRLWDAETRKKLDKDRFRKELGGVVEAYEEVAKRLGVPLD